MVTHVHEVVFYNCTIHANLLVCVHVLNNFTTDFLTPFYDIHVLLIHLHQLYNYIINQQSFICVFVHCICICTLYVHVDHLSVELKEAKTDMEKGLKDLADLKKQEISEVKMTLLEEYMYK